MELAAETVEGTTPGLKFAPKSGSTFADLTFESCMITSLNKTYPGEGSIIGTSEGAPTAFTHARTTAQGTLTFGGQKAGLDGKVTVKNSISVPGLVLTKTPFAIG